MEKLPAAAPAPIAPPRAAGFSSAIVWMVLAGAGLGVSFFLDAPVEAWVKAHGDPAWERAAKAVSRYGAWPWLMAFALVGLVIAARRRKGEWIGILIAMMLASSIAGLSADGIRGITGRTRPYATVPQGWYGMYHDAKWLVGRHAYNAFPSGHTAAATAFAAALWLARRKWGALLLGGAAIIAGSRIYLGNHHFSDVIAGAMLGALVAGWVSRRLLPRLRERWPALGD